MPHQDARSSQRAISEGRNRYGTASTRLPSACRVALSATGETARKRDPSTLTRLTSHETQIARLVGDGNSNKDVAAQLFLSPKTVEYHLAKVFTKLNMTSRAETGTRRLTIGHHLRCIKPSAHADERTVRRQPTGSMMWLGGHSRHVSQRRRTAR